MAYVEPTDVSSVNALTAELWNQDVVENMKQVKTLADSAVDLRAGHGSNATEYTTTSTSATLINAEFEMTFTPSANWVIVHYGMKVKGSSAYRAYVDYQFDSDSEVNIVDEPSTSYQDHTGTLILEVAPGVETTFRLKFRSENASFTAYADDIAVTVLDF